MPRQRVSLSHTAVPPEHPAGPNACYNFAATYKVTVDSYFLRHLATESVVVDVLQASHTAGCWSNVHLCRRVPVGPRDETCGHTWHSVVYGSRQTRHADQSALGRAVIPLRKLLGYHGRMKAENVPIRSRCVRVFLSHPSLFSGVIDNGSNRRLCVACGAETAGPSGRCE